MTTITWPTGLVPASADYSIQYDVQLSVMRSGRIYTHGLPGYRWVCTLTFAPTNAANDADRGAIEALVASLRGGARELVAPHFGRPIPNGTISGTVTLASAAAVGANTISVSGGSGTLKAGDIIGVGSNLVMVEKDWSGSGAISISPAIRSAANSGTSVVYNRPTTKWIATTSVAGPFPYLPGSRPSFAIELTESF